MLKKLKDYELAKSWLNKNKDIFNQPKQLSYEIVAKKVFELMKINSFGVWKFNAHKTALEEDFTFYRDGHNTRKRELKKNHFPGYFSKILEESVIIIKTEEISEDDMVTLRDQYLKPEKIVSLLDAPIFIDGNLYGVLCFESTVSVDWDLTDQFFVQVCADLIGRVTELMRRKSFERTLGYRVLKLEEALGRKLQEIDLANESFSYALEGAAIARWSWVPDQDEITVNDSWYGLMGYRPNEFPPTITNFIELLHPEDLAEFHNILNLIRAKTPEFEFRHRLKCKNGQYQWFLDRAKLAERDNVSFYHGFKVNISPIVELEGSIKNSQEHLESIIESLPIPVALIDKEFKYVTFSEKWLEEWGQNGSGRIEIGADVLNEKQPFYENGKILFESVLKGEVFNIQETLSTVGIDKKMWIRWSAQPWKLVNNEIAGIILLVENIQDQKISQIRLNQASKLTALGEMASGIAHEVNNPLGIIKGYIDLIKRQIKKKNLNPENLYNNLDKIDHTIARISTIVSGMRKFSRDSVNDEKVIYSLDQVVNETLEICREKFNNYGVNIEVESLPNPAMAFCRPVEISQVLLNLLTNSFHAISVQKHPWIKIVILEKGEDFIIEVIDSGLGIPDDILDKIFQPFFTTKDVGVGTGLGLSISKGIMEEHFGKLNYYLNQGHTCFAITLPKMSKEDS